MSSSLSKAASFLNGVVYFINDDVPYKTRKEITEILHDGGARAAATVASIINDTKTVTMTTTTTTTTPLSKNPTRFRLDAVSHVISNSIDFPEYSLCTEPFDINGSYQQPPNKTPLVVTPEWVYRSHKRRTRQRESLFSADKNNFCSGIVVCCAGLPKNDSELLCTCVSSYGGTWQSLLSDDCTHLLTMSLSHPKVKHVIAKNWDVKIVAPMWIDDSFRFFRLMPIASYLFNHVANKLPPCLTNEPFEPLPQQDTAGLALDSINSEVENQTLDRNQSPQSKPFLNLTILLGRDLQRIDQRRRTSLAVNIRKSGGTVIDAPQDFAGIAQAVRNSDYVICCYREHQEYREAIRQQKKPASVEWVIHVLRAQQLSNPLDNLFHYPVPKRPAEGFVNKLITVTNYSNLPRLYVKRLVAKLGAKFSAELSPANDVCIASTKAGRKAAMAAEWDIPVVNHIWLEDCFLHWRFLETDKLRYVDYPPHVNFAAEVGGARLTNEHLDRWIQDALINDEPLDFQSSTAPNSEDVSAIATIPRRSGNCVPETDARLGLFSSLENIARCDMETTPTPLDKRPGKRKGMEEETTTPTRKPLQVTPPEPPGSVMKNLNYNCDNLGRSEIGIKVSRIRKKAKMDESSEPMTNGLPLENGKQANEVISKSTNTTEIIKKVALVKEAESEQVSKDVAESTASPIMSKELLSEPTLAMPLKDDDDTATPATSKELATPSKDGDDTTSPMDLDDAPQQTPMKRPREESVTDPSQDQQTPPNPTPGSATRSLRKKGVKAKPYLQEQPIASSKDSPKPSHDDTATTDSPLRSLNSGSKVDDKSTTPAKQTLGKGNKATETPPSKGSSIKQATKESSKKAPSTEPRSSRSKTRAAEEVFVAIPLSPAVSPLKRLSTSNQRASPQQEVGGSSASSSSSSRPNRRSSAASAAPKRKTRASSSTRIKFSTTNYEIDDEVLLVLKNLGLDRTDEISEAQVLVTPKFGRTKKMLLAIASGTVSIVQPSWIRDVLHHQQFVEPNDSHLVHDPEAEQKFDATLSQSLQRAQSHPGQLFLGHKFWITSQVGPSAGNRSGPTKETLKLIIKAAGGSVLSRGIRTSDLLDSPNEFHLISCMEDEKIWKDLVNESTCLSGEPVRIWEPEMIIRSVLVQKHLWDQFFLIPK